MRDPSPPTTRVVDIMELVARRGDHSLRAADIARELGISKATGHAIVQALIQRGWLVRSQADKYLALGPGLAPVVSAFASQRTTTRAAVREAAGLAAATGWTTSVVELVGETMFVSTLEADDGGVIHGQRLEYAAPFGSLFAAWASADGRDAWLRRGRLTEAAMASYRGYLDKARTDGVLVERMSPVVEHVTSLLRAADGGKFPTAVRDLVGELLDEVVRTTLDPREPSSHEHPITSIAAPVYGSDGIVATALVLHPFRDLSNRDTRRAANLVRQAARAIEPATL